MSRSKYWFYQLWELNNFEVDEYDNPIIGEQHANKRHNYEDSASTHKSTKADYIRRQRREKSALQQQICES